MPEDGGVLENLPRSRPGRRSEKRAAPDAEAGRKDPAQAAERPAAAAAEAAKRAESVGAEAAEPAAGAEMPPPKPSARAAPRPRAKLSDRARSGRRRPTDHVPEESASGHPDPVGGLIRGAIKVAGSGMRVAGAVAGEVFRRLPRP
jgi:hypothetical protein